MNHAGSKYDYLFVISDLGSGGSQKVITGIANYLASSSRRVAMVTLSSEKSDFFQLDKKVERISLDKTGESRSILEKIMSNIQRVLAIRKEISRYNPKTVISFIAETNILVILATIGQAQRVIISERNDPEKQSLGFIWNLLRILLYRSADIVSANSRGAINSMKRFVPENKLAYISNPVTLPEVVPDDEERQNEILIVGSLTWQKAHDLLLESFAYIIDKIPGWRLVIVGQGELKQALNLQSETLGITEYIDWHENVTDVGFFYSRARIFVMPSRYEGTPNALLEALSYGLPVVISDSSPGPLEYVKNHQNGLVISNNDKAALSDAILKLVNDKGMRQKLGKNARNAVDQLSISEIVGQWEKLACIS